LLGLAALVGSVDRRGDGHLIVVHRWDGFDYVGSVHQRLAVVFFCFVLVMMILNRGLLVAPADPQTLDLSTLEALAASGHRIEPTGEWKTKPYIRLQFPDGKVVTIRGTKRSDLIGRGHLDDIVDFEIEQTVSVKNGKKLG